MTTYAYDENTHFPAKHLSYEREYAHILHAEDLLSPPPPPSQPQEAGAVLGRGRQVRWLGEGPGGWPEAWGYDTLCGSAAPTWRVAWGRSPFPLVATCTACVLIRFAEDANVLV